MTLIGNPTALAAGIAGDMRVLNNCLLTKASLLAGETGSIQLDLWRSSFADFPPTPVDSIVGASPLTISNGIKMEDPNLIGWTGLCYAGDVIRVNIDSVTNIRTCLITLEADAQ